MINSRAVKMSSAPPTIITLKTNFLTSQTRALSNPLHPTRAWQNANDELPEKQLNDALSKLNHWIQQHSKRVYAPQATRHVAEQIDALYTSPQELPNPDDDPEEGISAAADLTDANVIEKLPGQWPDEEEDEQERVRYGELVERLKVLEGQRREAQGRVARLRGLERLLEPFEDTGGCVQGNLVGRNGELEMELERMRMLLARVEGRVAGLKRRGEGTEGGGEGMDVDGIEG
ncbi:kinetochore Sim4 complex subunit Fta4, partial [Triangularia setosa]